ncbi:MAG TPA: sigma-70 family RNA polymerase sigma factor [Pyrinomonadaceae bacterium]|nr:sigma-70 family RNA polymerase sigma factor [Pyrinomonadaceae bacterium]
MASVEREMDKARSGGQTAASVSDHELAAAAAGGDEAAFGELMDRYRNPITNFLYRFLNDYEEAVDLAQETFVRLYFALDRYHAGYAFSTYLYRIASNLAISELRKRKRRRLFSLTGLFSDDANDMAEYQPADGRRLQDASFEDDQRSAAIARAIATLPEKYRVPIILRDIEEMSYDEISQVLEIELGTTKSRINRARGMLREKLDKEILGLK